MDVCPSPKERKHWSRGGSVLVCAAFFLQFLTIPTPGLAQTFNAPGFVSELVTTLPAFTPVGLAWAPDGRMFIWTKNGIVRVFKNGSLLPTPFINLSSKVNTYDDRGMWGLAFSPNFTANGHIFLTYVFEEGTNTQDSSAKTSRLTRVTADPNNPDVALPGSEVVILGSIGIPPCSNYPAGSDCIAADSGTHDMGTIRFAVDGKMFVGNGDGASASFADPESLRAQNLNNYSGKILRLNEDGTAPGDNPFDNGTNSIRSKVWAYGLRNPYRFVLHPTTGVPYMGDVGWNVREEVNKGVRGANYGWPCFEGDIAQPEYQAAFVQCQQMSPASVTFPMYAYDHSFGTAAIGGPIYTGTVYPELYRGNFFFADYSGNWIIRAVLDANGNATSFVNFATNVPAPVSLELGPDGLIYYVSITTGQIRRIRYNGPAAVASAAPTAGYSPLLVSFSSAGSVDPLGNPLTYYWDFGDGATSTSANPTHTYTAAGVVTYTAALTVTTTSGATSTATVKVTVGSQRPTAVISVPADGTSYAPGANVFYQGSATDPDDGTLPASAYSWTVLLHHNEHLHTHLQNNGATSGSFIALDHGTGSYSYEIILTVTDSSGLTGTASVLLPISSDTTPPTNPSGLTATAISSTQINLSWTASTDNGVVTGYRVERCQGASCSNFVQVATPGGTTYTDLGLSASTSYRYRVRATDAGGNFSSYSNIAGATTNPPPPSDTTPPTTPAGLTASAVSSSQINLSWTASTDNVGVTGYRVERCQGVSCSNFAQVATTTTTSYSNTGLIASTRYSYRVLASDAAGNLSGYSNVASATTQAPAGQSGLVAAYSFDEGTGTTLIDSSGNGNTGTINGATWSAQGKYGSALNFDGIDDLVVINSSASLNVTSGMTLEAWINPAAAQSGWRTILQREVDAYFLNAGWDGGPLVPAGGGMINSSVSYIAGSAASPVNSWTHVALTYNGSTLQLYVNGNPVASMPKTGAIQTNANPLRIGGNVPYGEYFNGLIDEVRIYNRALTQTEILTDIDTAISSPDTTPPSIPSNLTATATSTSQINLSWTASTDNIAVTGYRVERCQGAGCSNFAQIATPAGTSHSDTGLAIATTYSYRVAARDGAGNWSAPSGVATATTQGDTTPPIISAVSATSITSAGATIVWTTNEPSDTQVKYGLTASYGSTTSLNPALVTSHSQPVTGLLPSTLYHYQVLSKDASGNTAASTDATFTTLASLLDPGVPTVGLLSRWKFSEASGTLAADTAGSSPATLTNFACTTLNCNATSGWASAGKFGNAINLDGVNDIVNAGNGASLNDLASFTYSVWIYPRSNGEGNAGRIIEKVGGTGFKRLRLNNSPLASFHGQVRMSTTNATAISAANAVTLNQWQHVAMTFDGSTRTLKMYKNGVQIASGTGTGTPVSEATGAFLIGNNSGTGATFNGLIDDVLLYNRALSVAELQTLASGSPDVTPPVVSAVSATNLTETAATITWTTDELSDTQVEYGPTTSYGSSTPLDAALVTAHTVGLSGLSPSVTYHYRVNSRDTSGNLRLSADFTFTTPDTTPPSAPSSLTATAVSSTQINLSWTASTDNAAVTGYLLERCLGAGCSNFAQIATSSGTTHNNAGLLPSTSYSYRVRATDAAGNLSGYSNTASATTPAPPAVTGLVAAYAFQEGTGTTVGDSSGNGNTGTISGATWTTLGKFGNALTFDGLDDLVAISGSASLNVSAAMTLEAWIYPAATQSGWRTILQRQVDAYFLNASYSGGPLYPAGGATLSSSVTWVGASSASPIDAWTHVALTYNGSTLQLYVNGSPVASQPATGSIETNSNALRIGGNVPYGEFFNGRIDEVRVYNRALTQAEIQTDMSTPLN